MTVIYFAASILLYAASHFCNVTNLFVKKKKKVHNNNLNHTFALPPSTGGCQNLLPFSRGAF